MLDDFRGHDPRPNSRERAWMETSLLDAVLRVATLTAVAAIVGIGASFALEVEPAEASSAIAATASP